MARLCRGPYGVKNVVAFLVDTAPRPARIPPRCTPLGSRRGSGANAAADPCGSEFEWYQEGRGEKRSRHLRTGWPLPHGHVGPEARGVRRPPHAVQADQYEHTGDAV